MLALSNTKMNECLKFTKLQASTIQLPPLKSTAARSDMVFRYMIPPKLRSLAAVSTTCC